MSDSRKRHEALLYHAKPKPGKIAVIPTKKYATQHDLALAYSPGVAEPCLEIAKDRAGPSISCFKSKFKIDCAQMLVQFLETIVLFPCANLRIKT